MLLPSTAGGKCRPPLPPPDPHRPLQPGSPRIPPTNPSSAPTAPFTIQSASSASELFLHRRRLRAGLPAASHTVALAAQYTARENKASYYGEGKRVIPFIAGSASDMPPAGLTGPAGSTRLALLAALPKDVHQRAETAHQHEKPGERHQQRQYQPSPVSITSPPLASCYPQFTASLYRPLQPPRRHPVNPVHRCKIAARRNLPVAIL